MALLQTIDNYELVAYILSISLQVAGALLLIMFALSTKRTRIIRSFGKSNVILKDGNTQELSYDHDSFVEVYRTAYCSKISVIYILCGYLIGVLGEIGDSNKLSIATSILILALFFLGVARIVVHLLLNQAKVKTPLTYKELEEAGIDSTLNTISYDEIDAIVEQK